MDFLTGATLSTFEIVDAVYHGLVYYNYFEAMFDRTSPAMFFEV